MRPVVTMPQGFRCGLVASDLDGTLLPPSLEFLPETVAGVEALDRAGISFVISTGRMFRSAREMAKKLGREEGLIVCYQGALVADLATGEWLRHEPVDPFDAAGVVREMQRRDRHLNAYVADEFWADRDDAWSRRYADYAGVELHLADDLLDVVEAGPTKLVVMADPDEVPGLLDELSTLWEGRLQVTRSLPHLVEITAFGVTKSRALDFVAARLGVEPAQAVACGDGLNDVEMLRWAGFGVAVAEAEERVRATADAVVERDRLGELFTALAATS